MTLNAEPNTRSSDRKKIAVWYPGFMGGGAEAVALWMLEALKDKYDLTLFTIAAIDLERMNAMYGTHLSSELIKVEYLTPERLTSAVHFAIANFPAARKLSFHLLIRAFKAVARNYDLAISAYNATDLGCPGIQYIHWINVVEGNLLYQQLSKFSLDRLKSNTSLSNSCYTADRVKKEYGIDSTVVYPPVLLEPRSIPWEEKEDAFICSGRLTSAKEPHRVIEILSQVRQQGFDLKLYLTGGGGGVYASKYKRFLQKFIEENSDWVTVYEDLKYKDYIEVVSRCKYGIHYKKEPFGISIAEMLKAGAIPFVRSKGGQIEIVGTENSDLLFDDAKDGVSKIVNVLKDSERQQQLRAALHERKSIFSAQRFMTETQRAVAEHLAGNLLSPRNS
ncbi:glycosyltransferase family 4 protein [Oscillatoria sp. FACHB-1406]|uniref:glycosyltransferase family 4 protein n=1 Tax=Oscillatoria sp. FACHB-1406 TaxID=2692846 RepID=UPI001687A888|nr:glycosyltransferase family 4 protein [Oscillatoria sp. FACHB-1406]MBD2577854.1 glycosyltransferase family 4 protein [Oscillatoria sp. FACHB-1406]